jgi:hypothetical protein
MQTPKGVEAFSSRIGILQANYIPTQADITQYCSISSNINFKVIKRGRTTNWTKGMLSAIDLIVRLLGSSLPLLKVPTTQ